MTALLLEGATVVTHLGAARRTLAIDGGRLVEGGGGRRVDLSGFLVFPALVNAHDHLTLDHLPPAPLPVMPNSYAWIEAFQPHFQDPAMARALAVPEALRARAGGLKNALSGALTVAQHDPWSSNLFGDGFPVRVIERYGWAHSPRLAGSYGPGLAESRRATPAGAPWMVHLAEGTDAVAGAELAGLEALGLLDEQALLVHGVGLSEADLDRVIAAGSAVVWCPRSNRSILGRTLRPRRLFDAGRLALGTDSRLSGGFDLLEELREAAAGSCLSARELLRLATADGARVLRAGPYGALTPGEPADLLLVRDGGGDPFARLPGLRRAGLAAVVRGGRPLVGDPELFEALAPGAPWVPATLDGVPKRLDASLAEPLEAARLEPGLAISGARG